MGLYDRDDVLWLTGEHYQRQRPISHHMLHIPRDVCWYADRAGAERSELRRANFQVVPGINKLTPGIAAVTARVETGRLRILQGRCPNLLCEAGLYRYSDSPHDRRVEAPLDNHNHALAALRYLISRLDVGRVHRAPTAGPAAAVEAPRRHRSPWHDESLWTRVF